MNSIRIALVFAAIGACQLSAYGAPQKIRYMNHSLTEGRTLSALPKEVQDAFVVEGGIADRGGKFNPTDAVDAELPMRRFIIAGTDAGFALVALEHGGRGYSIEAIEFSKAEGKWTQADRRFLERKPTDLQDLVNLIENVSEKTPEAPVEYKATIYYSAAPWDGAAYDIEIPLEKTDEAPNPAIRVNIWGNPEFAKSETIRFTGKEDPGGGPGKGPGRASYQAILNKSWPENLAGTIVFKALKAGQPVSASYDFTTAKGKKLKGRFKATWGNEPPRVIR